MLKIIEGFPGCGKTKLLHDTMLNSPGPWLLALPRTVLIDEQCADLIVNLQSRNLQTHIEPIHSGQQKVRGGVASRVKRALQNLKGSEHSILVITHEALLALEPCLLEGWGIGIDEIPESGVLSGTISAGSGWRTLAGIYDLDPVSNDSLWHLVHPREDVDHPTIREIVTDDARSLMAFHKAAMSKSRAVYVDVGSWDAAKGGKRKFRWYSCWSPNDLVDHASTVILAGAGFRSSLIYHAAQQTATALTQLETVNLGAASQRAGTPKIKIHYYTNHGGSTAWWGEDDGSRCLVAISRYLEQNHFDGYWSGNDIVRPYFRHRLEGQECPPKVAGTNNLRHQNSCAFFYSNKAQSADDAVMEVLGLSRNDIKIAREDEDIIQFVFRGALRNQNFDGDYDIHLYSLDQAERLRDYFVNSGVTECVTLVGVDVAGIMDVVRPDAVKPKSLSCDDFRSMQAKIEERKAKDRERSQRNRDRDKAQKVAEGTYRGQGRPRKLIPVRRKVS